MVKRTATQRFLRGFSMGLGSAIILLFILSAFSCANVRVEYKPVDLCEFHMECT